MVSKNIDQHGSITVSMPTWYGRCGGAGGLSDGWHESVKTGEVDRGEEVSVFSGTALVGLGNLPQQVSVNTGRHPDRDDPVYHALEAVDLVSGGGIVDRRFTCQIESCSYVKVSHLNVMRAPKGKVLTVSTFQLRITSPENT